MMQEEVRNLGVDELPGLFPSLAAKARNLPTGSLVALSLCCWIAIALWTIPDGISPAIPAPVLAIGSFGLWGILERVRANYPGLSASALVSIAVAQKFAAAIGALSVLMAIFALLGVVLGVFIL
jgi:hypothetical protein